MAFVGTPLCAWRSSSLAKLIEYIVAHHHGFLRRELPAIDAMLACQTPLSTKPRSHSTSSARQVFQYFRRELEGHLQKEEMILFPLIAEIESEVSLGRKAPRRSFGSIANPIGIMELEHEFAHRSLRLLRAITREHRNVPAPTDACDAIRAKLAALESDLETHSRLEDEILFPKAIVLESDNY